MTVSYQEAVRHFEEKDYQSAQDILINLKESEKNNADVSYFLAVVKSITGDYDGAVPLFKEVMQLKPGHTEACYNLALCLQNQNNNREALIYYEKAAELNPFLSEAYNNIAIIYKGMGKYGQAEAAFKKAIKAKPGNSNAMSNLSNLTLDKDHSLEYQKAYGLFQKKDFTGARELLTKLLDKNPGSINLLNSLGIINYNLNDFEKAAGCYKQILAIDEKDAEAEYSLGVCYQSLDNNDLALSHYKKAVELNPRYVDAFNNLGLLYASLKNYEEAEKYYLLALKYNPEYFNAIINLGSLRLHADDFDKALEYFNRALAIAMKDKDNDAGKSVAYSNIGFMHLRRKNIDEAIKYFNTGIELNPDSVLAHYNKAEALLVSGRYEEGWKEYEWRTGRKDFGKRKFEKPFKPEYKLKGKRVLVFAEQGLGDALQFVRYLPMLKEKGCYVIFECGKEMHSLLNGFEGVDEIIERNLVEKPDIEYDYEVPLLNLPQYFKTAVESVPADVPYLKTGQRLKEIWSSLINDEEKVKIGIVWAGSPIHTNDKNRSVRLQQFLPLLSVEKTHFYSLQKGFPVIQAKDYQLLLTDLDDRIKTFSDTAAIMENLDIVITVDTSVAHLAGALGKEVWVLLPYMPDWRWLLEGKQSLWYPTMKLYRQPAVGDWNTVFAELKKDLISFVKKKNGEKTKTEAAHTNIKADTLYLGLTSGENFGWGVCSKYLKKELSRKINVVNIDENEILIKAGKANGTVFHALNNNDFSGLHPVRGTRNIGYTFFEYELNDAAVKNAINYELVLGGSSWNEQKLRERGVENTGVLIQGVDPELFYPEEKGSNKDLFVIFSGGKFELRKGQDLVLKAIKILQQKYSDIILINAWYNLWPHTMNSMSVSKHINYEYKGETWKNFMVNLCTINEIDGNKVFTLPITPNEKLRDLYASSDIGLFPNRCEGGTNLVLMEYMACGKPVIASYNSGHKDVLTASNSLRLERMHEFKLFDNNKKLIADWEEPDIDEIVAQLEYAYHHREEIKKIGKEAGEDMKNFTWERSADSLFQLLNRI